MLNILVSFFLLFLSSLSQILLTQSCDIFLIILCLLVLWRGRHLLNGLYSLGHSHSLDHVVEFLPVQLQVLFLAVIQIPAPNLGNLLSVDLLQLFISNRAQLLVLLQLKLIQSSLLLLGLKGVDHSQLVILLRLQIYQGLLPSIESSRPYLILTKFNRVN